MPARRKPLPLELHLDPRVVTDAGASPQLRRVGAAQRIRPKPAPPPKPTDPSRLSLPSSDRAFHFTYHVSKLCDDICRRLPAFRHIDMRRVLVTFVQTRKSHLWGLQAKLVPLRFPSGEVVERRRGHEYRVQQFFVGGLQMYYVLTIYVPRFLNQPFGEKLVTLLHELYHVGPGFTGDIRRFEGAHFIHTSSQKEYDKEMEVFAKEYLSLGPPPHLVDFLQLNYSQLVEIYGLVVGVHVPSPKLIPIARS